MLPLKIHSEIQRIDSLVARLDSTLNDVDDVVQNVFANHLVLASAGLVEKSVNVVLSEYSGKRGSKPLSNYVGQNISYQNSLNCEKIQKILDGFDKTWWPAVEEKASAAAISSVDSVKALRDQIAHGKPNGTGFTTVKGYYRNTKQFVRDLHAVIDGK